jgi:hypothetical protein
MRWLHLAEEHLASGVTLWLDCEGLGSTQKTSDYDSKLMSLCLLLSSVFVFNSKGAINEAGIGSMSVVCALAKLVALNPEEGPSAKLLWVLRDFVLQLEDSGGMKITPTEYLEGALKGMEGTSLGISLVTSKHQQE